MSVKLKSLSCSKSFATPELWISTKRFCRHHAVTLPSFRRKMTSYITRHTNKTVQDRQYKTIHRLRRRLVLVPRSFLNFGIQIATLCRKPSDCPTLEKQRLGRRSTSTPMKSTGSK